jgi:RecA-family ATPase
MSAKSNTGQNQAPETENLFEEINWFVLEPRKNKWLVDGLLLRRGSSMLSGKPKAGKSTVARSIVVNIIKGQNVLGRAVEARGKKLTAAYFLMEGKDDQAAFAEQMRALGVTAEEAKRLRAFKRDKKGALLERVHWLVEILRKYPADIVVVDTLRLFTGKEKGESNSYDDTVEAMDNIEPTLRKSGWDGHLMLIHHARKDDGKKHQMLDSVLGSSGHAASVNTVMVVNHPNDNEPARFIGSKQNETEKCFGDLPMTELLMDDAGAVSLGRKEVDIMKEEKKQEKVKLGVKIQQHISDHPGCTMLELQERLATRKQKIVEEISTLIDLNIITRIGEGTKKSPFTYVLTQEAAA